MCVFSIPLEMISGSNSVKHSVICVCDFKYKSSYSISTSLESILFPSLIDAIIFCNIASPLFG